MYRNSMDLPIISYSKDPHNSALYYKLSGMYKEMQIA